MKSLYTNDGGTLKQILNMIKYMAFSININLKILNEREYYIDRDAYGRNIRTNISEYKKYNFIQFYLHVLNRKY